VHRVWSTIAGGVGGEIGIFGKRGKQRRNGPQIMQGIDVERDGAQRPASRIVVAVEVPLEYQAPLAHNDDPVEIPNALLRDCLVEQRFKVGCEASFVWRDEMPA